MHIRESLKTKKKALLNNWLERTIETYPEESRPFLLNRQNRFTNPLGANIAEGLEEILEGIIYDMDPEEVMPSLDKIIRIRAVQEFSPSEAISFMYLLKDAVKEILANEMKERLYTDALLQFQAKVDSLTLLAFDVYMKCREDLFEIRVNELKRRIPVFMRQFN